MPQFVRADTFVEYSFALHSEQSRIVYSLLRLTVRPRTFDIICTMLYELNERRRDWKGR